jgi:hypothetical protein
MPRTIPTRVSFFLLLLFLLGLAVNALTFIDLHWTHWLLTRGNADARRSEPSAATPMDTKQRQQELR